MDALSHVLAGWATRGVGWVGNWIAARTRVRPRQGVTGSADLIGNRRQLWSCPKGSSYQHYLELEGNLIDTFQSSHVPVEGYSVTCFSRPLPDSQVPEVDPSGAELTYISMRWTPEEYGSH